MQQMSKLIEEEENSGNVPTKLFRLKASQLAVAAIRCWGRRAANILNALKTNVHVLRAANHQMVAAIDLIQNKVNEADPTALTPFDKDDIYHPINLMGELYCTYLEYGIDTSVEAHRYVFTQWVLNEDTQMWAPLTPTPTNKFGTYTRVQVQAFITAAAKAAKLDNAAKITPKSLRCLNVSMAAGAGVSQPGLNDRMGWKNKQSAASSSSYCKLVRTLAKRQPTFTHEQRKALEAAKYCSFDSLSRGVIEFATEN